MTTPELPSLPPLEDLLKNVRSQGQPAEQASSVPQLPAGYSPGIAFFCDYSTTAEVLYQINPHAKIFGTNVKSNDVYSKINKDELGLVEQIRTYVSKHPGDRVILVRCWPRSAEFYQELGKVTEYADVNGPSSLSSASDGLKALLGTVKPK